MWNATATKPAQRCPQSYPRKSTSSSHHHRMRMLSLNIISSIHRHQATVQYMPLNIAAARKRERGCEQGAHHHKLELLAALNILAAHDIAHVVCRAGGAVDVLCARDHKLLHIFRDLAIQQLRHGAAIFPVQIVDAIRKSCIARPERAGERCRTTRTWR